MQKDKVIQFLLAQGYKEVASQNKKYQKFAKLGQDNFLFVGSKGAVRIGKSISDSYSVSGMFVK